MVAMAFLTLLLVAPASALPSPVGLYEIRQMEMGGGLELQKNGRFRYAFSYGAVDEDSDGDWTFDGTAVHLTTNPMPKQPTFELVSDAPAPKCTLSISVDWGRFGWNSPPNVLVTYQKAPTELHFLQADENGGLHPDDCSVTSLLPIVPMFDIPGAPLALSTNYGHKLALRFVPNDLGRAAFKDERLILKDGNLVMQRYDAEIRFIRVRP
jgi:hypothetical protein